MEAAKGTSRFAGTDFVARLDEVKRRLDEQASRETPTGLTEPDPGDTERWQAGQVWAHMAEFVPYWHAQLQQVIGEFHGAALPFGRTRADPGRRAAIEQGRHESIAELHARVEDAIATARRYLAGLPPAAWQAVGRHPTLGDMNAAAIVERFIVGHLEEHADQLDGLR